MELLPWLLLFLYVLGIVICYRTGLNEVYRKGLRDDLPQETMKRQARLSAYRRSLGMWFFSTAILVFFDANTSTVIFGGSLIFAMLGLPFFLMMALAVGSHNAETISRRLATDKKA